MSDAKTEDKGKSNLETLRSMWQELPVRDKFYGFVLVLCMIPLMGTPFYKDQPEIGLIFAGTFGVAILPVFVAALRRSISVTRGPELTKEEGTELQALCQKLKDMESETSLVIKLYGLNQLTKDFDRLFPYHDPNAGGVVSRFAAKPESDAQRLLMQIHEIIRHNSM